jgi:hypothetical protein
LTTQVFAARDRRRDDVAINAARFLGKPFDKGGNFGFGLGKGFSLLAGKKFGKLLPMHDDEIEPAA